MSVKPPKPHHSFNLEALNGLNSGHDSIKNRFEYDLTHTDADNSSAILKPTVLVFVFMLTALMMSSCGNNTKGQLDTYTKQGQQFVENGSYRQAIITWNKALKLSPGNPDLYYRLAVAYQHLAQFEASTQRLRKAIELNHKTVDAYFMMAENYIFAGNFKAAEKVCDQLEIAAPGSIRLLLLKGDIATVMGRYLDGETYYQKAIETDSSKSAAYFKKAANLLAQKKNEAADTYFSKGVASDDQSSAEYWLHRSEYQAMKGNGDPAQLAMKRALELQPNSLFIKYKIIRLLQLFRKYNELIDFIDESDILDDNNPVLQKLYAEALLNADELEKADLFFQQFSLNDDQEWLMLLGKKSLLQGSYQHAINYFEQALAQQRDNPNANYMLALSLFSADKENLSKRTLIQLLSKHPNKIEAELVLAFIYYKQAEYGLSIDYLERAIKKTPGSFRAYVLLGNCMLAQKRYKSAEANFMKALALDPQSLTARYYLALVKEIRGQVAEAIRMYQSIISEAPKMADAGLRLADLLIQEKRGNDAISLFSEMSVKYPDNGYFDFILGYVYQKTKQPDKATGSYRQAVRSQPEIIEGYKRLASLQPDNWRKIQIIQEALELMPTSKALKIILADFHFRENNLDAALEQVKDIYRQDPQSPSAANNLAWLYLESGTNLQDAFELARTAFEMDPDNPHYAHTLGWAFHKKGHQNQAIWYIKEAIKLVAMQANDESDVIRLRSIFTYHLGLAQFETGQLEAGEENLQLAVKSGLPSKYKKRAVSLLKQGRASQN